MGSPAEERFDWFVAHVTAGTFDLAAAEKGFAPDFLAAVPATQLVTVAASLAPILVSPHLDRIDETTSIKIIYDDMVANAAVEEAPPHRFTGLLFQPASHPVHDERLADAPWTASGDSETVLPLLQREFTSRGLVGVVAAGFSENGGAEMWTVAGGFADIDLGRAIESDTPMLAGSITKLLTAAAALQLVAEGKLALDDPARDHLLSLDINGAVTVRHLLTHTAGVSSVFDHYGYAVGDVADVLGRSITVDFPAGEQWKYSNGGYAVLGEVISDIDVRPYEDAVQARVLDPLGMKSSSFATRWPDGVGPGYDVVDGRLVAVPRKVPSVLAAGGLCTTVSDLGRFIAGWQSLLPDALVNDALTPASVHQGLGWRLTTLGGETTAGHNGGVLGFSSSLLWRTGSGRASVLLTNRRAAAETVNAAALQAP